MSDDRDDSEKAGLVVVFGTVALVVAGVIGYAVVRTLGSGAPAPAAVQAPVVAPEPVASAVEVAPVAAVAPVVEAASAPVEAVAAATLADAPLTTPADGVVYFRSGKAALPADAAAIVGSVMKLTADKPAVKVVLSGFHDQTGDPAVNAQLAKERAVAVRAALVEKGLTEDRVVLRKPEVTTGSGSNREARRVELRVLEGN